jgi:hypothetical protein
VHRPKKRRARKIDGQGARIPSLAAFISNAIETKNYIINQYVIYQHNVTVLSSPATQDYCMVTPRTHRRKYEKTFRVEAPFKEKLSIPEPRFRNGDTASCIHCPANQFVTFQTQVGENYR